MSKPLATPEMLTDLLNSLKKAPASQIDPELQSGISDFQGKNPSTAEIYDFLSLFSKRPNTEISAFVQKAYAVDQHYARPD
jgi:hypothetical protein